MAVTAIRSPVSMPVAGYGYRVDGLVTGSNAVTVDDPGFDPSFVPIGLIVIQAVGENGGSQAVFASWEDGTLTVTGGQLVFNLWCSSGADTAYVDVLVY